MCKSYGTNARSIKIEDINRVTGYDPNNTGDGKKYNVGDWLEYGSKVTYTANKATNSNGLTYERSFLKQEHLDGRIIGSNGVTSIIETSTYYHYYPNTLTSSKTGTTKGIETTGKAYEMIFGTYINTNNGTGNKYWIASSYVYANAMNFDFGVRYVFSYGYVYGRELWHSLRI